MKLILALFAVQFVVALAQLDSDQNAPSGDGDSERNRRYAVLNHYPVYDVKLYSNEAGHSGFVIYGAGYGPQDFAQKTASSNTFAKKVTPAYKPQAFAAASYNTRTTARPTVRTTPRKVTTKKPAFTSKSSFGSSSAGKPRPLSKQTFASAKTNVKTTVRTTPRTTPRPTTRATPRPTPYNKKPVTNLTPPVDCRLCSQYCSAKFY